MRITVVDRPNFKEPQCLVDRANHIAPLKYTMLSYLWIPYPGMLNEPSYQYDLVIRYMKLATYKSHHILYSFIHHIMMSYKAGLTYHNGYGLGFQVGP